MSNKFKYPKIELPNSWKNDDRYILTTEELLKDLDKEKEVN